jgi:hypothetical protein
LWTIAFLPYWPADVVVRPRPPGKTMRTVTCPTFPELQIALAEGGVPPGEWERGQYADRSGTWTWAELPARL